MGTADMLQDLPRPDIQGDNPVLGCQVNIIPADFPEILLVPVPGRGLNEVTAPVDIQKTGNLRPVIAIKSIQQPEHLLRRTLQTKGEIIGKPLEPMRVITPALLALEVNRGLGAGQFGNGPFILEFLGQFEKILATTQRRKPD